MLGWRSKVPPQLFEPSPLPPLINCVPSPFVVVVVVVSIRPDFASIVKKLKKMEPDVAKLPFGWVNPEITIIKIGGLDCVVLSPHSNMYLCRTQEAGYNISPQNALEYRRHEYPSLVSRDKNVPPLSLACIVILMDPFFFFSTTFSNSDAVRR